MNQISAEELDKFLAVHQGRFLQSANWAGLQNRFHRQSWFVALAGGVASILEYELPLEKKYLYVPKGPVVTGDWQAPLFELQNFARAREAVFLRLDPEVAPGQLDLIKFGFRRSPKETQARQTQMIDLSQTEDELLLGLHPKTRYNLRLAQKKGLQIRNYESREKNFDIFWELMRATAKRDRFHLHAKEYYEAMLTLPEIKLFLVRSGEKIIAGAMVSFFAGRATYLHGASDYEARPLMAPYLLHWQIILEAKQQGLAHYDLGGVAPASDPSHSWAGISRFKSGFGGDFVEYVGSFDYVVDRLWYGAYLLARKFL